MRKSRHFFYAVATLVGFIVGAGIFGLPFVMERMGYFPALTLLLILSFFIIINSLSLAEVMLRTPGNYFIPGLCGFYFGKIAKRIQFVLLLIGNYGAILAYLVIGAIFLKNLLSGWVEMPETWSVLIFLGLGLYFIYTGVEELGIAEMFMLLILLVTIGLINFFSFQEISVTNLTSANWSLVLAGFGVLLFALDGTGGITTVKQILTRRRKMIKPAILLSYLIVIVVYVTFTAGIIGTFGSAVSEEALVGIGQKFGNNLGRIALTFGFLAVFTSFLVTASSTKGVLETDFKIGRTKAWLMVWVIPLVLFFLGFNNFIEIISLMGVFFGFVNSIVIAVLLGRSRSLNKKKPELKVRFPLGLNYLISIIFFAAMIYEFYSFF